MSQLAQPGKSKLGRVYDCRPSPANHWLMEAAAPHPEHDGSPLPDSVDLRPLSTPVRDQGQRGYCYAFATAAWKEINCAVWGGSKAPLPGYLSPEYVGWRTQLAEGTWPDDDGGSLADALAVVHAFGVPPEAFLPYGMTPTAGDASCDVAARPYRCGIPCTVDYSEPDNMKSVLAKNKPVLIGFEVTAPFETTGADGLVPADISGQQMGGHAVVVVGYGEQGWLIRNSWGPGWALGGHCIMPYGYEACWFDAWTTPPSPPGQ